jgi:amino acid adenylation domain-containing protein
MYLHEKFCVMASEFADRCAIEEPGDVSISYAELDGLSDRLRDRLASMGVARGDRVGFCIHKSIDSVAAILGILKIGAVYVPSDATAPASRNAYIFANCAVKVLLVESALAAGLREELASIEAAPAILELESVGGGEGLRQVLAGEHPARSATVASDPDDLAYILYTSGSTGQPKGVMLSHRNARRFVDWCGDAFAPEPQDRFSSHAPFHFDLSILDLYLPLSNGSTLVLVPEDLGKEPQGLGAYIAEKKLTVWYSTPSILSLLNQFGRLEELDCRSLRIVFFAGEVFPIGHLILLREKWPWPLYFNLYGPTETNVCTYFELPPAPDTERVIPYPIGSVCPHYESRIVDQEGVLVPPGAEGELLIAGDGVMQGYWDLDEQTAAAFTIVDGKRWYHTGDLVVEEEGELIYVGRKDRMVKKRGYRIELGEIESGLYRHEAVREAAVVALADPVEGVQIVAHLSTKDGGRISIIQLKTFCSKLVPSYMVPDRFVFHSELPKTSTDKTDYQMLEELS